MNYNKHLELKTDHALLGASTPQWLNKTTDEILLSKARQMIPSIGTALHDIARKHIQYGFKMYRYDKKEVLLSLMVDYNIPGWAIDRGIIFDQVYNNLMMYVNDCVMYGMVPEQKLVASPICFGTVDAITKLDEVYKTKKIRIHDLKNGTTPPHIEQLMIYAALFCIEYNFRPGELLITLCIYQNCQPFEVIAEPNDIAHIMDRIKTEIRNCEGIVL